MRAAGFSDSTNSVSIRPRFITAGRHDVRELVDRRHDRGFVVFERFFRHIDIVDRSEVFFVFGSRFIVR